MDVPRESYLKTMNMLNEDPTQSDMINLLNNSTTKIHARNKFQLRHKSLNETMRNKEQ